MNFNIRFPQRGLLLFAFAYDCFIGIFLKRISNLWEKHKQYQHQDVVWMSDLI